METNEQKRDLCQAKDEIKLLDKDVALLINVRAIKILTLMSY